MSETLHGYWPCACVKGGGKGQPSTHIKLNPPSRKLCSVCGATKAVADRLAAQAKKAAN